MIDWLNPSDDVIEAERCGYNAGYRAGHDDGYEEGHADGYEDGYDAGYDDSPSIIEDDNG